MNISRQFFRDSPLIALSYMQQIDVCVVLNGLSCELMVIAQAFKFLMKHSKGTLHKYLVGYYADEFIKLYMHKTCFCFCLFLQYLMNSFTYLDQCSGML